MLEMENGAAGRCPYMHIFLEIWSSRSGVSTDYECVCSAATGERGEGKGFSALPGSYFPPTVAWQLTYLMLLGLVEAQAAFSPSRTFAFVNAVEDVSHVCFPLDCHPYILIWAQRQSQIGSLHRPESICQDRKMEDTSGRQ